MRAVLAIAIAAAFGIATPASAQKPGVYPAKGQSTAQQAKDDGECQAWAKQDTGIDPVAVANAKPVPPPPQGQRLRGAARGAVIGEIVDDDAGKGAAIGAVAGARRARIANAANADAQKSQALDTYYRAYGACMQGRGYSVK